MRVFLYNFRRVLLRELSFLHFEFWNVLCFFASILLTSFKVSQARVSFVNQSKYRTLKLLASLQLTKFFFLSPNAIKVLKFIDYNKGLLKLIN